jgi:hypothetical protein
MANSTEKETLSVNDQPISIFLEFADLAKFKTVFQGFGVEKFDHLNDVQDDDLLKFGMYVELWIYSGYILYIFYIFDTFYIIHSSF